MNGVPRIRLTYLSPTFYLNSSSNAPTNFTTKVVTFDASKFEEFNIVKDRFEYNEIFIGGFSRFAFSFFDLLEIPPYSFIYVRNDQSVKDGRVPSVNPDLIYTLIKHYIMKFKLFNENPQFKCRLKDNDQQIYCIFRLDKPLFIGYEFNKVHLFVKQEYILYAVLKIASLNIHFMDNAFEFKFSLFNARSNLRPEDTQPYLLERDGGISATIIIYGSSNPIIMSKLLKLVLALFPDHEELGLMDTTGPHKLSPFNIRLNSLVSYATGDRATSLDAMIENIRNGTKVTRTPPYTIPAWFDNMTQDCTPAKREDLNRHSQLFLGIDACDSDGSRINYYEKCKDPITKDKKYCYITRTGDTLDPRTFIKRRKNIGGRPNKKHSNKVRSKRRNHRTKKRK